MASKGGGLLGALEKLGIVEPASGVDETEPAPQAIPAAAMPQATPGPVIGRTASDPDMVEKIRDAVTSSTHSPRFSGFLEALKKANVAFPNDPRTAARAAIAFSSPLTSADLHQEIDRSVAASLIEAESQIKADIARKRERHAATLDAEKARLDAQVEQLDVELKSLQTRLNEARTEQAQIDTKRSAGETEIASQEQAALASLAAVKAEIDSIKSMLP